MMRIRRRRSRTGALVGHDEDKEEGEEEQNWCSGRPL